MPIITCWVTTFSISARNSALLSEEFYLLLPELFEGVSPSPSVLAFELSADRPSAPMSLASVARRWIIAETT